MWPPLRALVPSVLPLVLSLGLPACSSSPSKGTSPDAAAAWDSGMDGAPDGGLLSDGASPATDAPGLRTLATIDTSMGILVVELSDRAPVTTQNFKRYADDGFYDGLIFHRVIPDFMIQGGGFEPGLKQKKATYPPIRNEALSSTLSNLRGTIAMARTLSPHSATSQFYINVSDNAEGLDPSDENPFGYAVFGTVISGMDVADAIVSVTTHTVGTYENVPVEDVVIRTVRVEVR